LISFAKTESSDVLNFSHPCGGEGGGGGGLCRGGYSIDLVFCSLPPPQAVNNSNAIKKKIVLIKHL